MYKNIILTGERLSEFHISYLYIQSQSISKKFNQEAASVLSSYNFAPTAISRDNLIRERKHQSSSARMLKLIGTDERQ